MNETPRIVFTDLDGTLLNSSRGISTANRRCLEEMGKCGIIRVIATGRSLFSFRRLEHLAIPADYLIFTTGAGILDLNSGQLLYRTGMSLDDTRFITACLRKERVDFMVHYGVPDNHRFIYSGDIHSNSDFSKRIELYRDHAEEFVSSDLLPADSAQTVAIFPDGLHHFKRVEGQLVDYQITRTTSPLDGRSTWMEILPPKITKGSSAAWLCHHLGIDRKASLGIGNDFNDLSLLEYTESSFVVGNAPEELKSRYPTTASNNDDGFSAAARSVLPDFRIV